jgi:ligand-binding sensor domain-containing protein/serine phosphatase RsbU (regulator of sigma subunit)
MRFYLRTFYQFTYIALLLCFSCLQVVGQSNSLTPYKNINKLLLDHWTTEEGLPSNATISVLQSSDGYLWITSYNGIIRFDGVHFKVFDKQQYDCFKTNPVLSLCETSQKQLLIGTENSGIVSYQKGKFETLLPYEQIAAPIRHLNEDKEGNIWIERMGKSLLIWSPHQKKFLDLPKIQEIDKIGINFSQFDKKNNIVWLATNKIGLVAYHLNTQQYKVYNESQGLFNNNIQYVYLDKKSDRIWVGTNAGLNYIEKDKVVRMEQTANLPIRAITQDLSGSVWFGTQQGLLRYNSLTQQLEKLDTNNANGQIEIRDLTIDYEESLWITTYRNGLFRLKNGKFTNYSTYDGLSTPTINHLAEWQNGKILVGTENGVVNIIDNDTITELPFKTQFPHDKRIKHILVDSKNRIWLSTYSGLLLIDGQKETLYTDKNGLSSVQVRFCYEDRQGNIWIGTKAGGLIKFDGKQFLFINKEKGFPSDFVMCVKEKNINELWIGTNDEGIVLIDQQGKIKKHYTKENGLASNVLFSIFPDKNTNNWWFTTNGGLAYFDENTQKFGSISMKDGLPDDNVFDIQEDDLNNFWITSGKGIIKVQRQDLLKHLQDTTFRIRFTLYEKHDGMVHTECTGATFSLKSRNGEMWFPTLGGVVRLNPKNILQNNLKPPVYMENVRIDETIDYYADSIIVIPAGVQRFWIDYTALSYVAPQKVAFKYKLANFDKHWVNANQERRAIYTNVSPGTYTFQVIASNNDGVWNETGASIKIIVLPYFWQTKWFYLLVATIILGLIWWLYRKRTAYIENRNKELEALIQARTLDLQRKSDEITQKNVELEQQKEEILAQKEEITITNNTLQATFDELQHKNENILASINYAQQIQRAMLPSEGEIHKTLPDSFVFYVPRDIVSGDFYWFYAVENEQKALQKICIAAVDCTGHGVPGAFMSMAGNAFLNQIVKVQEVYEPHHILNLLHQTVRKSLNQAETDNREGMDIAFCTIDIEQQILLFAGANNPLLVVQADENTQEIDTEEIAADKKPIGGSWGKINNEVRNYSLHTLPLNNKNTHYYIFSDGFQDQFGGELNKKFTKKRLKALLASYYNKPFEEQKNLLANTFKDWKGEYAQIDDVLVIGFKC